MKRLTVILALLLALAASARAETAAVSLGDWENDCQILIDLETGRMLTPPNTYCWIIPLGEGLFSVWDGVQVGGKWDNFLYAMMNARGEQLTDHKYYSLRYYPEDGIVIAEGTDSVYSVLNEQGEVLWEENCLQLVPNGEGGFLAMKKNILGKYLVYIDAQGNHSKLALPVSKMEESFSEGLLAVQSGLDTVYLNARGETVLRIPNSQGQSFLEGTAIVAFIEKNNEGWPQTRYT